MRDARRESAYRLELLRQAQFDGDALALLHLVIKAALQLALRPLLLQLYRDIRADAQVVRDAIGPILYGRHQHPNPEGRSILAACNELGTQTDTLTDGSVDTCERLGVSLPR